MNGTTKSGAVFSRVWSMPNAETFTIPEIGSMVKSYLKQGTVSVDPFARNKNWATYTNDINPDTSAQSHMEARDFLRSLVDQRIKADVVLFDPPYSPRQVAEVYGAIGLTATMQDTQTAAMKKECRKLMRQLCEPGSVVLSFGWNSVGMGAGFETKEIMLVCHGGDHNDTICMAQEMKTKQPDLFTK